METLSKYRLRREQGLCGSCGEVYTGDSCRCPKCLENRERNRKAKQRQWLEEGLCTSCGNPLEDSDYGTCEKCREKSRLKTRKHY